MWRYDIANNTWALLCGNRSVNVLPDYDTPYPGGCRSHSMVINNNYIYIFGGYGYGPKKSTSFIFD